MKTSKDIKKIGLSQTDKILLVINKLSKGKNKNVIFEDIVVQLLKDYKIDFSLRGYPNYPDSEMVSKALYRNLRQTGLINYGNKFFILTERGKAYVENLLNKLKNKKIDNKKRYLNSTINELKRINNLQGYKFYINHKLEKINDTDFYNYLGASVKSNKVQILGRFQVMSELIKEIINDPTITAKNIIGYHKFLFDKFDNVIKYYQNMK